MIPFIERPTAPEADIFGPPSGYGYLGSVSNPRVAYAKKGSTAYYRAETDNKCNPDNFTFPPGQAGLQKISYSKLFQFELKAGELKIKGGGKGGYRVLPVAVAGQDPAPR
ncbi:MAG: hypothetical protein HC794_02480, partial [Nitrospiraceae bacterium]|nr:hypothetical protein [Nitrospiraceae bacterium]